MWPSLQPLPEAIAKQMQLWRAGLFGIPYDYILFHRRLAKKALDHLKEEGYVIHRYYESGDGWLDGMRVMHSIVEKMDHKVLKLRWHDGNQEWFLCGEHGSMPLRFSGF